MLSPPHKALIIFIGENEGTGLNSEGPSEQQQQLQQEKSKLSRIAAIFRSPNPALDRYGFAFSSDFRRYWMPDSSGRECYECQERFTAFRRRHHCRLCGQIFCSKCCNVQVPGSLLGYTGDLRLCTYCAHIVLSNLPHIESKLDNIPTSPVDEKSTDEMDVSVSTIFAGPVSWCLDSSAVFGNSDSESTLPEKMSLRGNNLAQLSVTELAMYDCPSTHPSTADFGGVDEHEPEWVKNIEMTVDVKSVDSSNLKTECADYVRPFVQKGEAPLIENGIHPKSLQEKEQGIPVTDLRNDGPCLGESIERCFEMQAEKLLLHLFKREGLDPVQWWEIIWAVSHRVSSMVKVDMEGRKAVNVMKHVHIKNLHVAVEKPSASVIEGTVCSKSIRHDSMPSEIHNASILALEGSIEYERVSDKLSSIEPIITQESEYLRNQVDRMLSHRPSLVLVERNVAGLAVQMLLEAGITLVSNIKSRVLQRIARSTGADVMPSLDAQILNQKIGFCSFFHQEKIQLLNGKSKCLLIFDDCPPELGCSIVLRGSSRNDLCAAKRILKYAILALYSNHLEVELLSLSRTRLTARSSECTVCTMNAVMPDSRQVSYCTIICIGSTPCFPKSSAGLVSF
ncbi:unnamed protein product [Gongylonema pulchrum]|uniref:FYVE-type domain-containing protein n=1 Tax=Gongylonema pulchrum TaxID=637853 RepID=A0A3P7MZY4_9BILA|nr:unnamed protein product [Gongylonema pulchrum]